MAISEEGQSSRLFERWRTAAAASESRRWTETIAIAVTYLLGYVAFDWVSFVYPFGGLHITPWNPPPGLSLGLLLLYGFRFVPLTCIAPLLADLVVRHMEAPFLPMLVTDIGEGCIYALAAWCILHPMKISRDLRSLRDVGGLIIVALTAAAVTAFFYVQTFRAARLIAPEDVGPQMFRYWVGDAIGIMIMTPLLLVHRQILRGFLDIKALLSWEVLGQMVALAVALWMMFFQSWADGTHIFYMMFVPLVWVAARYGLSGITPFLALTQFALIEGTVHFAWPGFDVTKLQFLTLTLSVTALLLGVAVDERERARQKTVQAEARLRTLIDMAPDALLVADDSGGVEIANKRFEQMSGIAEGNARGRRVPEFIVFPLSSTNPQPFLRHDDGALLPVEISIASVPTGNGHNSLVSIRDVSRRKQIEERKNERRSALEQASRASLSEQIAASLAHELNQPLSALIGYVGTCSNLLEAGGKANERLSKNMAKAVAQAEKAGAIVGRLTEFFKSGRLETAPVPVRTMIDEVVELFIEDLNRIGGYLEVRADPGLVAQVDRRQVEQVLVNLLRNSLRALAESGEPRKVEISAAHHDHSTIGITLSDNGKGVPPAIGPKLFEAFVTTRPDGVGLGLSISRSIIESHGGRIWHVAREGGGATFHFTLPKPPQELDPANAG
jgi:signal transduction histidine kinase